MPSQALPHDSQVEDWVDVDKQLDGDEDQTDERSPLEKQVRDVRGKKHRGPKVRCLRRLDVPTEIPQVRLAFLYVDRQIEVAKRRLPQQLPEPRNEKLAIEHLFTRSNRPKPSGHPERV